MTPQEFIQGPPAAIVLYPDPILLQEAQNVKDLEPWKQIGPLMVQIMQSHNGAGLAAPQVGLSYKVFVLNLEKPIVVINPKILEVGNRLWTCTEGCLSIPGKKFSITRPRKIKAEWLNLDGEKMIVQYEGWTGRVFQHEYDHIFGKLINKE